MDLVTFGAAMKFAADFSRRAAGSCRSAMSAAQGQKLKEALRELLSEAEKNQALIEQIRRENVTEMILEPITGLFAEDAPVEIDPAEKGGDAHLLQAVVSLQGAQLRFFERASLKIPLPEAARAFRRMAERMKVHLDRLRALKID